MSTAFRSPARRLAVLLAVIAISACAASRDPAGHRHGHDATRPHGGMMAGAHAGDAAHGARMEGMDMDRLCAMHRAMHDAPADQRDAIQEQHMKGMSPEMRRQLMEMALRQCH